MRSLELVAARSIIDLNHELSADDFDQDKIVDYVKEHYPEYFREEIAILTKEESHFELSQQKGLVQRRISIISQVLKQMSDYVGSDTPLYEHYMPQQPLIDLAIEYGKLVQLDRINRGVK
jgi:hypothetical protein